MTWQAVAGGAVNYTVKSSTQPGEVNTPPEGALKVKGISSTSTILTALERGTTYYIWVVGVSEGGEGPHSDRMSGVTYDSELDSTNCISLLKGTFMNELGSTHCMSQLKVRVSESTQWIRLQHKYDVRVDEW